MPVSERQCVLCRRDLGLGLAWPGLSWWCLSEAVRWNAWRAGQEEAGLAGRCVLQTCAAFRRRVGGSAERCGCLNRRERSCGLRGLAAALPLTGSETREEAIQPTLGQMCAQC